jgi:short-subunit dehydrogenase
VTRSAVIVGGSSGIGAALAVDLARCGYSLGLAARRRPELEAVAAMIPTETRIKVVDISDTASAMAALEELIAEMDGVDLLVITAGTGRTNAPLSWAPEADTIAVNVAGFTAVANVAMRHFTMRGAGHLVAISSIAAIKGHEHAPAYGASKAFVSRYLQALRHRVARQRLPICITDVQAGYVDTPMAQGDHLFWVAPVRVASAQICEAIRRRQSHVYVTRRWRVIAWLLRIMPEWLYNRV